MPSPLARVLFILVVLAAPLRAARASAQEGDWTIERIVVKHRFATNVGGPARAALSPKGTLVVDEGSNSLIVHDSPANVAAVRSLVSQLDVEPRSVTLRVRAVERRELERSRSDLHVAGSTDSRGETRVAVGMVLGKGTTSSSARTTQTVTVQSGQRAEIAFGGTQPVEVGRGRGGSEVAFRDFGERVTVEPTVLGDGRVRVRLSPRSSTPVDPRSSLAHGARLDTEVVLGPGDSLVLGGIDQQGEGSSSAWPAGHASERRAESLVYVLDVSLGSSATAAPASH